MRLVDDWRKALKWFSVQANLLNTALLATWLAMPEDMRASMPQEAVFAGAILLLVLGTAGRLIDQGQK